MNRQQRDCPDPDPWQWPLDLACYDRTPSFSSLEMEALVRFVEVRTISQLRYHPEITLPLGRLTQPITDAVNTLGLMQFGRTSLINLLLLHMHDLGKPFWGWTVAEWATLCIREGKASSQGVRRGAYHHSLIALAYVLCGFCDFQAIGRFEAQKLAYAVFGQSRVDPVIQSLEGHLVQWGYRHIRPLHTTIYYILLLNRSPYPADLSAEKLAGIASQLPEYHRNRISIISRVLVELGILARPVTVISATNRQHWRVRASESIVNDWAQWVQRWFETSTLSVRTRYGIRNRLLQAGRWLCLTHPEITSPAQWTRELAVEFVAAVNDLRNGDWAAARTQISNRGKPMGAANKRALLVAMRTFFKDCQEWEWISSSWNPIRCFGIPHSVQALIGPNPRVIADDIWAKLLTAGLQLTEEDLPGETPGTIGRRYPLELVRAVALVWLFGGLRSDEIRRLRVGCVRWQQHDIVIPGTEDVLPKDAVCFLDVPVNKTNVAFTKPVDRCIGFAIQAWEQVRPPQQAALDPKTAEVIHYLFSYRNHQIGATYINKSLIPMLCRKGGVPESDARGRLSSHRARATIASQLFNSKEPMDLFELQEWLGHRNPNSTKHYIRPTPTRLAKAYSDAEYFKRNTRQMEVLLDQTAIREGTATTGDPYLYYDLGHGYCTYDFFDQCPHRMACARCSYYRPKSSMRELLEEAQRFLRLKRDLQLTELERAAIDLDEMAITELVAKLQDIPTPAGPTPHQLAMWQANIIPLEAIDRQQDVYASKGEERRGDE